MYDDNENRKEDKKQHILETIDKDLDVGDRWLGIRQLKSKYNVIPYHNEYKEGKHLSWTQRGQKNSIIFQSTAMGKTKPRRPGQKAKQTSTLQTRHSNSTRASRKMQHRTTNNILINKSRQEICKKNSTRTL